MKKIIWVLPPILFAACCFTAAADAMSIPFNDQWRFIRMDIPGAQATDFDDSAWETVELPHTAHIESLVTGPAAPQWQGVCWYRKTYDLPASIEDKEITLRFEGAMNSAQIWVNGISAGQFRGGYLPYVMDITKLVHAGQKNIIAMRLDNRDNPLTGPKPLAELDFNLYGGLYRDASLTIQNKLHITDPILADTTAGGGIFVTFPEISEDEAVVRVKTQVKNDSEISRISSIKTTILDAEGKPVVSSASEPEELTAGAAHEFVQELRVMKPNLWSPNSPYLYHVRTELVENNKTLETQQTRIGIRKIQIDKDGLRINGKKVFLRGVNRHQEYPYIGNALPDDAQYRDALKIKEAGFDFVRLSHYPQSPAFLDACDELGILVMDSILGWQYFNKDPAFADQKYQECHQLVRRDRNHPCVLVWEASLNETRMPESFVQRANAIVHEEYPGNQCYTCGWESGYDVFIQARQHGGCRSITNRPCVVDEYGDWEYYAQNAGFNQDKWEDLKPADRSSRQLRGDGEVRLLQQALNFQEAHNDNLKTKAFADCVWVMFDYNRGYADDLESSGVMDIFRLPKFSYWFFHSQRDADEKIAGKPVGPILFIANYWTDQSPLDVRIFSNCEAVALYLNGKLIGRRRPDVSRITTHLRHPPFTFTLTHFEPGTLSAVGYLGGKEVARQERHTPGEPADLSLRFDLSGRYFATQPRDTAFCYADIRDKQGTVTHAASAPIFFGVKGQVHLIGSNPILSEAGTGTVLLDSDIARPRCAVYAICLIQDRAQTRILSAAASPNGDKMSRYVVRYTTDGSEPISTSIIYSKPINNIPRVRAAIFVNNQMVAMADTRTEAASTDDKADKLAMMKAETSPNF
jgi:beta-galactosidase